MSKFPTKRRVLIVGEGRKTEFNYFVGFRNTFQDELDATATSIKVACGKGGDAISIVKNAIWQKRKFKPNPKRGDRVFLLLDTEGAGRAPELPAAEKLAAANEIEIVYSCPAFEYWLLCHFQGAPRKHFDKCDAVIVELDKPARWNRVSKNAYDKSDYDIFDRLSDLLANACIQALEIDLYRQSSNQPIRRSNPSTQVYELIAIVIGVQTGAKCPMDGNWKLVGNDNKTISLTRGDVMPSLNGKSVKWYL